MQRCLYSISVNDSFTTSNNFVERTTDLSPSFAVKILSRSIPPLGIPELERPQCGRDPIFERGLVNGAGLLRTPTPRH
jgi:hypothetical protein